MFIAPPSKTCLLCGAVAEISRANERAAPICLGCRERMAARAVANVVDIVRAARPGPQARPVGRFFKLLGDFLAPEDDAPPPEREREKKP